MRRRGAEKEKRGRKAARPKRQIRPGITHRRVASTADLQEQLDHRTRELREALRQQTATADVLKIISGSPGELQPVFDTMLARATELCEASYGAMWLRQEDGFRNAAFHGALPEAYTDLLRSGVIFKPGLDLLWPALRSPRSPFRLPTCEKIDHISAAIHCRLPLSKSLGFALW
jgi:hypothetical protein